METSFDEWNEQLRELLKQQQEKLASNFQGRKLQEYRDSVSELQVGAAFKFQITNFNSKMLNLSSKEVPWHSGTVPCSRPVDQSKRHNMT